MRKERKTKRKIMLRELSDKEKESLEGRKGGRKLKEKMKEILKMKGRLN